MQLNFENDIQQGERCKKLFRKVIKQALYDFKNAVSRKNTAKDKKSAEAFFDLKNDNFLFICDLAGYNYTYIYKIAELVKNGKICSSNSLKKLG